ncbi:MAG: M67 family metallopeptidase [Proteobacteria bacterium]|nr:M67 family metallopeptidase [Pseudomonadota bacterium]
MTGKSPVLYLSRDHLKRIAGLAEAAYPRECCGLLVGRLSGSGDSWVSETVESPNVDGTGRRDRFEVDSALYIDLQRRLRDTPERVLGVYHSHCDHRAQPSATDLELAWEPGFVWLIVAVEGRQAIHSTAHMLDADGARFREIGLRTDDWGPYPQREPLGGPGLSTA